MFKKLLILPAAALAFACSKGDNQTAADSALNSDLSTAAASQPYTPLDSITAAERNDTGQRDVVAEHLNGSSHGLSCTCASHDKHAQQLVRISPGLQRSGAGPGGCEAHQA